MPSACPTITSARQVLIAKPYSQSGIATAINYLHQCIREPPPRIALPLGFTLAPAYQQYLQQI